MTRILVVSSSPVAEQSVTRRLIDNFLENWTNANGEAEVTWRDLSANPLPHLDGAILGAFMTAPDDRSEEQAALAEVSDKLIAELKAADVVLIGAPMYNFGIPSGLKAWIDHVARAGLTFRYSESGPVGLLTDKKAFVMASRGGIYAEGTPGAAMDFVNPYLRSVLGFIGIDDVKIIAAEGVALGEDAAKEAVASANRQIEEAIAA